MIATLYYNSNCLNKNYRSGLCQFSLSWSAFVGLDGPIIVNRFILTTMQCNLCKKKYCRLIFFVRYFFIPLFMVNWWLNVSYADALASRRVISQLTHATKLLYRQSTLATTQERYSVIGRLIVLQWGFWTSNLTKNTRAMKINVILLWDNHSANICVNFNLILIYQMTPL